ncbi:MAG: F0F1 ATP synthase subunit epsilon [uncultured bacterium]|nr:MAG: F0F1 ATP synthase subunit epsilon [uncultured bacterium]
MTTTVQLDIVSLEANIFSGQVEMVVVTGEMGELGILPGHTQLLTSMKPGQIRIVLPGNVQEVFYVSGGVLEVQPYIITILADTVVRAADLDEVAAITARENAERLLADKKSTVEFTGLLAQLAQATAQLRTIKLAHTKKSNKQ